MPTSLRFYRDMLGFTVVTTSPGSLINPDHVNWAMLRLSDANLMLNTAYEPEDRPSAPDAGTLWRPLRHRAFLWLPRR